MAIIDLKVPSVGESITEVSLSKWLKPNGSLVAMDEPICVFESDKATLELPSEVAGILIQVASEGDDLEIGAIVARIDTEVGSLKIADVEPDKKVEVETPEVQVKEGVEKSEQENISNEKGAEIQENEKVILIEAKHNSRESRREKMSRMRRTIAKRLVSAKNETAMLTTFNEVDMKAIIELRTKYNDFYLAKYGIKMGFMSLFAKACAEVLLEIPEVNAFIDGEELVFHNYVDISIAISTPNGLVVPPIFNVELLQLWEFEMKLKDLAERARSGKLTLDEMRGGTFTITNGGVFGSLLSTPILNEPQSAILGMHAIQERPVVINGQIVIRPMMYIALSYDHRVIDGSSSVTFLVKVKERLEDPLRLFLKV